MELLAYHTLSKNFNKYAFLLCKPVVCILIHAISTSVKRLTEFKLKEEKHLGISNLVQSTRNLNVRGKLQYQYDLRMCLYVRDERVSGDLANTRSYHQVLVPCGDQTQANDGNDVRFFCYSPTLDSQWLCSGENANFWWSSDSKIMMMPDP